MDSRSLLIIAPVIALTAACATGPGEDTRSTSRTSQALCTAQEFCDTDSSSYTVKEGSTSIKGEYADPGEQPPAEFGKDEPFACDCQHKGPNGSPLQLANKGSVAEPEWVCVEVPDYCCTPPPTSDPSVTYKAAPTNPDDPPTDTVDPDPTCGPSSYVSVYNPCAAYSWAPYVRCNWNGCWCSSVP